MSTHERRSGSAQPRTQEERKKAAKSLADAPREEWPSTRLDHLLIAEMVEEGSRVIDVGCGDGQLLKLLEETRDVDGRGIELSQAGVNHCVAQGLAVIQGDADKDLENYPDGAFDYAILSQTIQATRQPKHVLEQLLRIGKRVIVSFPNFGLWTTRLKMLTSGRMPVTPNLPAQWYNTDNIHLCTILDFVDLCKEVNATVEISVTLNSRGNRMSVSLPHRVQNVLGAQAVFLLTLKD